MQHLEGIVRKPRISGLHVCRSNLAASSVKTAESRERADILAAPSGAVLIEGCDVAAVADAMAELRNIVVMASGDLHAGIYRLEHALRTMHH